MIRLTRLLRTHLLLVLTVLTLSTAQAETGRLFTSEHLSSTLINTITQDRQGFIWIGTDYGLNRFDGYRFTAYLNKADNPQSLNHNNVQALFVDSDGQLWVGTAKGLARYDAATDSFQRFDLRADSDDEPRITNIIESPKGTIVVGTSGFGLFEADKHATDIRQINQYSADDENDYYWGLFFDRQGRFWKSDNNGTIYCFSADPQPHLLLKHQPATGLTFQFLQHEDGNVLAISTLGGLIFNAQSLAVTELHTNLATLKSAAISHDGNMLLGTTGYGLWLFGLSGFPREPILVNNRNIDFSTSNVTAVFEDPQRNLWVGCNQRGLLFCPDERQAFQGWSLSNAGVKSARVITSMVPASNGGVWAALGDGDLYHFDGTGHITQTVSCPSRLRCIYRDGQGHYWATTGRTLYSFDEPSGRLQNVKTFDGDFIFSVSDDGKGRLFISTFSAGMTIYDTRTSATRHYDMYQREDPRGYLCNNWIFSFLYDSQGLLWIATSSGVSCYDPEKDTFNTYGWHNILEGWACLSMAEDAQGNIVVGTDRGLFRFNRQKNEVLPFPDADQSLSDKSIGAVCLEKNGDLWCSTSMGIWHYAAQHQQMTGYLSGNGLREREYLSGVGMKLTDGRIAFATSEGPVVFHPVSVSTAHRQPSDIMLTTMLVGGERVNTKSLSDGRQITTESIEQSHYFTLSYLDDSFSMEFSTFDFSDARNVALEYKLNDDRWTLTAAGDNTLGFNHLRPGTYRLYVRAAANGLRSPVHAYTITVRAPWYRTTLAWLLYVLTLALIIVYLGWRYYRDRKQKLAEEKMQFLINATHDIRTPLTLILSPLHKAMQIVKAGTAGNSQFSILNSQLETIDHNARRILNLVNQILDIRKIDKQQMQLKCKDTQMVPFLNNIYKVFESHARERGITFRFEHPDELTACIDPVQFDKVIQNLLSNAFKFTPDGGEITIDLRFTDSQFANDKHDAQPNSKSVNISVTDSGTGLNEADIPHLFTRFYQSASNQAAGREGTGIGLNLCKMIVEMHHGQITARNRTDGVQGSVFTVTIPQKAQQTHLQPPPVREGQGGGSARILLVDDDAEITDYIAQELSSRYRFSTASNGKEALRQLLATDAHFDLVVSDIMMPEMDGFTLLRTIKSNINIAHLPVILLTSEAAVGNRLEGLERGADAFMAKPFLVDELHMQIDNLLAKAQRLKAQYGGNLEEHMEKVEQRDVYDNDQRLMERIVQSVNKNLGDSDFSVEQLASEVGLSRSQLHRRMKELTGLSASDFVRNIRMEQAARLLRERKVNISQVAYSVGFSSLGTFSKVFKQHFGQSPSEYAAQK